MPKIRMHLDRARNLAESYVADLAPACERIEIAGSIRRKAPTVGDIELVLIAKPELGLFGGGVTLDGTLTAMLERGRLIPGRINGPKAKQFILPHADGMALELYICNAQTWGALFTIRTGPADFARQVVTGRDKGGRCPPGMFTQDGRLWDSPGPLSEGEASPIDTPEEVDYLWWTCGGWYAPEERAWAAGDRNVMPLPIRACPKCSRLQVDRDGFGVVHCEHCGYCAHPSITAGKCDLCGAAVDAAKGAT